jgi:hypothetical protein
VVPGLGRAGARPGSSRSIPRAAAMFARPLVRQAASACVTSTVEGDINLLGILGLDPEVRNGFEAIRVVFHVKGHADAEKLAALVEQSRNRSAVYDVITHGVPVSIDVATA